MISTNYHCLLLISLVLLTVFGEAKVCNTYYLRSSTSETGHKKSFEYFPWIVFQTTDEYVRYFKITQRGVKHVCKRFLPHMVDEVIFVEIGLEYIQPGFFENSKVKQAVIEGNNLKTIQHGVFNGTAIRSLILNDNKISSIEPNAFENMFRLEAISLDDNQIKVWDPSWFANAQVLYEVSVQHNLLSELPEGTTKHIVDSVEIYSSYMVFGSLDFDNNYIKYIHPNAFSNLKTYGSVSLSNNNVLILDEEVFKSFDFLLALYMNKNDFICFTNETLESFRGVKKLFLGSNKLNRECVDRIKEYFYEKNDLVHF